MSAFVTWLRRLGGVPRAAGDDALAQLILAAREDPLFRARVEGVLRLPAAQREALVNTAVHEMRLRGEPAEAQAAFAALASEEGAHLALQLIADPARASVGSGLGESK
jgi:hypothetical protein